MALTDDTTFPSPADVLARPPAADAVAPAGDLPVTAAAFHALQQELVELRREKDEVMPERLRVAHAYGDGSNNDDTLAIREEESILDARLARLESILGRARVVPPSGSATTVAVGSRVRVVETGSGETYDYVLDSAYAPGGPGAVSPASPVGAALLGRTCGELVRVVLPNGRTRELTVVTVSPAPAP
jgi:transcription elongation factor GreA